MFESDPPPRRLRVLLIDDEPLVRRSLARVLSTRYEVATLESAGEALLRLGAGETWDAVLCDLWMPGLDGIAFYEALASSHAHLLPHLAIFTGGVEGARAEQFFALHHVEAVPKALEIGRLFEVIEDLSRVGR
jgi:CheY-like chemotaxis protein